MKTHEAQLVLRNACVITLEPARPHAGAVAIREGRIIAVGDAPVVEAVTGSGTRTLDLAGATVVPGFNDAHCHLLGLVQGLLSVDVSSAGSIPELQGLLRRWAEMVVPGQWIVATGYDDYQLKEGRHPHRRDLDQAAPVHPVRLLHRTGHAWVLNSAALDRMNIRIDTEEPSGGLMERDMDTGEPNGVLFGMADFLRERLPPLGEAELREGVRRASNAFLGAGITSIQDTSQASGLEQWRLFQGLKSDGIFAPRLSMMVGFTSLDLLAQEAHATVSLEADTPHLWGVKIVLDEATGRLNPSSEELKFQVARVHALGIPVAIHAVEREAVEAVASVLEHVLQAYPRPHQHRIEHCAECPPPLQQRLARLGVTVVTQPPFIYYRGDKYLSHASPEVLPYLYPTGSLLRAGLRVAGSSDAPVVPFSPLTGICAAVTRRTESGGVVAPGEAVTPEQALALYTTGAAHAAGERERKGSISPGKLADLTVLSADPTAVPPEEIGDIRVTMTILGGKVT
ncbi:MAG: amidohydrolase [Dehalococcoidia bacterium]|nr:amidohydrolase [Dehalococcoidia bacterium]